MLPERPGGNVRFLHRRRQHTDAVRRKISDDRDPGDGGEGSAEFLTEVQQKYQNGCEAIFTDGGSFEPIVRKAAETTGGKVIGIVTDESQKSTAAVISAENKYEEILTEELEKIKNEEFKGGKTTVLGIQEDAVGLTTDTSQMQNFNEEQNQKITKQFKTNKITLQGTKLLKDTAER